MRRRTLIKSAPVAATLPLAGCLEPISSDEGDEGPTYPDEWRSVDPADSEYVTFQEGEFDVTGADPPEEGATLDGREAWRLVTEMAGTLREASFRLALESDIVEGAHEGTWRQTLWRNAEADVVYQRQVIERPDEPDAAIRDYNDGTRYVAADRGEEAEYYHVPDPHWHRDRVDSHLMMSFFQLLEFVVEDTVSVDGTDLRRVRHTDGGADRMEIESATFFVGEDGIVRNAHADYGTAADTPIEDRFAIDGAVEITAGEPTVEEPEWTDDALETEREPSEGPA